VRTVILRTLIATWNDLTLLLQLNVFLLQSINQTWTEGDD